MKKIILMFCIVIFVSIETGYASEFDATATLEVLAKRGETQVLEPDQTYIGSMPAPDGATRGLAFDGTYIWSADNGDGNSQNGRKIYKLDANTGAILGAFTPPGNDIPFGLTWDGSYLWHVDFGTDLIYKIDTTTMSEIKSFAAPNGYMFDLAWDGAFLYGACGLDAFILKIDTIDGSVVDTIHCTYTSPYVRPLGLAYLPFDAGQVWTCDGNYGSNMVSEWDFATISWVYQWDASPASYPNGLAYDPVTGYLWISCWDTDSIYIFDVGTGIEEKDKALDDMLLSFETKPNPASSFIDFDFLLPTTVHVTIDIYDISGRMVSSVADGKRGKGSHKIRWNTKDLPSGIYFIRIEGGSHRAVNKISIQK